MFQSQHLGILSRSLFIAALLAMVHAATAATNTVTTTADDNSPGSLRYLLGNSATNDTIVFAPALSGTTILLTNGSLSVGKSLDIDASALPAGIQINGNHQGTVFMVGAGISNTLTALTITNGYAAPYGVGNYVGDGGGVLNSGTLTLNRCIVAGNMSAPLPFDHFFPPWGHGGGGVANFGTLTMNQCTVTGNSVTNGGVGDGIYNDGTLVMNGSTLVGDGIGVGFFCINYCSPSSAHTTLNQCTMSGGGISYYAVNRVIIYQSTLVNAGQLSANNFAVSNSLVVAAGYPSNAIPDAANNIYTSNGNLSPLDYYGGLTQTMPPLAGSPAIDNGNDTATNYFATDQRGLPRLSGLHVDCGATEATVPAGAPLAITQPATAIGPTAGTLNATVTQNGATTTSYFQFGTTTNYGTNISIPALNTGTAPVSNSLAGLLQNTIYHFRIVASNSLGTAFGDDLSFQTGVMRIVSNTNDSGPGSLRDATAVVNVAAHDTISFDNGLAGQTILLTSGQITISNSLTLDVSTLSGGLTVNGNTNGRVFQISSGATAVFNSLTITNGKTSDIGGGIYNAGTLTLNQCTIAGNTTSSNGGGIYNAGALAINQSTLSGNNAAGSGGGLYTTAFISLNQSTLSGNSANSGGGIYTSTGVALGQSTVSGNSATTQGGGMLIQAQWTQSWSLNNSIVAGNVSGDNLNICVIPSFNGPPHFYPYGVNITDGNPMLAPLGNYGGPTQTMPPLPSSPAIDASTNSTSYTTDQRGFPCPTDGNGDSIAVADIGAVEGFVYYGPGMLSGAKKLGNGMFQFGFPNYTNQSFTVFATTNLADPLNTWSNLGPAVETPASSGQYQFTDPQATNNPIRFYRVRSP